jgi:hypothetical protein
MVKNFLFWSLSIIAIVFVLLAAYMIFVVKAGPVNTSKSNSVEVAGIVYNVYEAGSMDLAFKLENDLNVYYINRGLDNKFELSKIQEELLGEKVNLWYAKHRSVGSKHLTKLQLKDSVYYNEWNDNLSENNVSL